MKNITEATKEEFLLFFAKDVSGISCRPYFEKWLNDTRLEKLKKASEKALQARYEKEYEKLTKELEKFYRKSGD